MKLSEKIQYMRKKAGLNQEELAEAVGVSRQAVSKWETGDAAPEIAKLLLLSRAFGVTADWLISDAGLPEQKLQPPGQIYYGPEDSQDNETEKQEEPPAAADSGPEAAPETETLKEPVDAEFREEPHKLTVWETVTAYFRAVSWNTVIVLALIGAMLAAAGLLLGRADRASNGLFSVEQGDIPTASAPLPDVVIQDGTLYPGSGTSEVPNGEYSYSDQDFVRIPDTVDPDWGTFGGTVVTRSSQVTDVSVKAVNQVARALRWCGLLLFATGSAALLIKRRAER